MRILDVPGQGKGKRRDGSIGYRPPPPHRPDPKKRGNFATPQIMTDIPPYISPVTGEPVGGRAARREDLIKNDCYEIDPPTTDIRERQKKPEPISFSDEKELNERLHATYNNIGGIDD
jgi:hypothetical protein